MLNLTVPKPSKQRLTCPVAWGTIKASYKLSFSVHYLCFAPIEDMRTALGFIKDHAKDYNIDAQRIALGGFSAEAMTAINLAYGEGADV